MTDREFVAALRAIRDELQGQCHALTTAVGILYRAQRAAGVLNEIDIRNCLAEARVLLPEPFREPGAKLLAIIETIAVV